MIDLDGLEILSEEECRRLLAEARLGRVGICVGALPAVLPVNYLMAGDEILFFTAEGTKLQAATHTAVVAFEVDHFNAVSRTGWSVLVVGRAAERDEPAVARGAMAAGLRPWAFGDRSHLVSLTTELVSGRRVIPHGGDAAAPSVVIGPRSRVAALTHPPVRIGVDWTLRDAATAMRTANVSSALVGRDEAIITERDLARALTADLGPAAGVASVFVSDFIAVDQDVTVIDAASVMLDYDVRHLVVRNHRGDVMGLLALRDLLRVLVDAMDPAVWAVLGHRLGVRTELGID
jgi:CBS domain-containing protein